MVRYDGTTYQPLCFHDGTYTNPLIVRPAFMMGTARILGVIVKATAGSAGGGTFKFNLNGTDITSAINFPTGMGAGTVWEYYLKPTDFTSGYKEVKSTDVLRLVFGGTISNIRVGVILG